MKHVLLQIDAFTSVPYKGNPAAVCWLEPNDPRIQDEAWMQNVALEMNLSETAYVWAEASGRLRLRWFTPQSEAVFCGHATLAAAHALWSTSRFPAEQRLEFHTLAGKLVADSAGDEIRLDLPALSQTPSPTPQGLEQALGASPLYVGENPERWLVELDSETTVRDLRPNMTELKAIGRDVCVTARSAGPEFDFVSRYFAPIDGIDEDPVTGSAHCLLAPYWGKKLGLTEMTGFQASARGGIVRTELSGDRVLVFGHAVTVAKIELLH